MNDVFCYLGEDADYNRTAGGSVDISAAVFTVSWDPSVVGNVLMNQSKQFVISTCLEQITCDVVC